MTAYTFALGAGAFSVTGQAVSVNHGISRKPAPGTATSKKPKIVDHRNGFAILTRIRKTRRMT
jgi:hypothetical protein